MGEPQKLLPCPFCGCTDVAPLSRNNGHVDLLFLVCNTCEAEGPCSALGGTAKAIERWNTRAHPDPSQALREALLTEAQWRTLDDFRKYWHAFADADVIPIDGDDFTARLEAEGYIEMEKVTRQLLREVSFPEERGLELGGWCWALTDKGRAALSPTPDTGDADV